MAPVDSFIWYPERSILLGPERNAALCRDEGVGSDPGRSLSLRIGKEPRIWLLKVLVKESKYRANNV